jgi:hypothetical protein
MKEPNVVTVDDLVRFLNELLAIDRDAVSALFTHYIPCNEALLKHPTVQVATAKDETSFKPVDGAHPGFVGVLGILNGLFGIDERGSGFVCRSTQGKSYCSKIESFGRTKC